MEGFAGYSAMPVYLCDRGTPWVEVLHWSGGKLRKSKRIFSQVNEPWVGCQPLQNKKRAAMLVATLTLRNWDDRGQQAR